MKSVRVHVRTRALRAYCRAVERIRARAGATSLRFLSRMEERHSSLEHSTITFTFYPCLAEYTYTYTGRYRLRCFRSEPAFYSRWSLRAARSQRSASRVPRTLRSRGMRGFFLLPRPSSDAVKSGARRDHPRDSRQATRRRRIREIS